MQMVLTSTKIARNLISPQLKIKGRPDFEIRLLDERTAVTIKANFDQTIRCIAGSLWITANNHPEDVILSTGDEFVMHANSKFVVEALQKSQIALS